MAFGRQTGAPVDAEVTLIDSLTGKSPTLGSGDQLITLGEPKKQRDGSWRQLCEVRPLATVQEAEVAVYDAIETLRGRVEVAGLGSGQDVPGSPRIRAQRLRQAGRVVGATVNDLARAVEASK